WEPRIPPLVFAEARNLKTGKIFEATDRDARLLERRELHSILRERADAQEKIVRLHRQLRWPDPKVLAGKTMTSRGIAELLREQPQVILDMLGSCGIPAEVTGLSTLDQFSLTNDYVTRCEQRKGGDHTLSLLDWVRILKPIGSHAEVKAVHDSLLDIERQKSGKKKHKKRSSKVGGLPSDLQDLELTLEALSLDDESKDVVIPRCVHCRFITHGVKPAPELKRMESPRTAM
ncbi:hypothetical protein ACFL5O_11990, partial [Myxococcota bacterium]